MNIEKFLKYIQHEVLHGSTNKHITSVSYDSKEVTKGGAFVAIKGFSKDGHQFVRKAIENGAIVIFVEKNIQESFKEHITVIKVNDTRLVLSKLADYFYKKPSHKLSVVGITGTNGKTTTAKFLNAIYNENNISTALLGTIGLQINNKSFPFASTTVTTPESVDIQRLFNDLVSKNVENFIMEVSSHSLELHRVSHVNFDTGIFINLSPDHLELHKTLEGYFQAKKRLFELSSKINLVNVDDPYGRKLAREARKNGIPITRVGIYSDESDIKARDIKYSLYGASYTVQTPSYSLDVNIHLPGEVNVYNSLLAIACAYENELPKPIIKKGIETLKNVNGRFNIIYDKDDLRVIIDFAHTEDALKNLLETVKPFVKGKLILVFGVYADMSEQGKNKRVSMGKIAGEYADLSVVTLDNPKHFDQEIIINQIVEGVNLKGGQYEAILDRKQAIEFALKHSKKNDIVVIAGKGHETYQMIGDEQIYLNEKEIVLNKLKDKALN